MRPSPRWAAPKSQRSREQLILLFICRRQIGVFASLLHHSGTAVLLCILHDRKVPQGSPSTAPTCSCDRSGGPQARYPRVEVMGRAPTWIRRVQYGSWEGFCSASSRITATQGSSVVIKLGSAESCPIYMLSWVLGAWGQSARRHPDERTRSQNRAQFGHGPMGVPDVVSNLFPEKV